MLDHLEFVMTTHSDFVSTGLGRLHVSRTGTGPPVVLWHSLFVDSQSWGPLITGLAKHRTVYAVDGPSHGKSDPVRRDFSFDEVVAAAHDVLASLGSAAPVDWVGNAWGGHVGIRLATETQPRIRTLTTIATPVQGFTRKEKFTIGWPPVLLYQALGPARPIAKLLSDSLLGAEAVAAQPDRAAAIMASFTSADRKGMLPAIRSMMLHRKGIEDLLPAVSVPTLVLAARDDATGWRPDEARRTSTAIPDCRVEEVAGGGHIAPLLVDADRIEQLVVDFWGAQPV